MLELGHKLLVGAEHATHAGPQCYHAGPSESGDIYDGFCPTLLLGIHQGICQCQPALCICVQHLQDHMVLTQTQREIDDTKVTLERNPKTDRLRKATQKADMRCREQ